MHQIPNKPSAIEVIAVERGEKRGQRRLTLSDGTAVWLSAARVREAGLTVGATVSAADLQSMLRDDARELAHTVAVRLLAVHSRSAQELSQRLRQRGIDTDTIDRELRRLRMAGLIDDEAFAQDWVETRQARSARSARMLAGELRAKGVDRDVAEAATADLDDAKAALALAQSRWARMTGLDAQVRERRLIGLLQRRGFSHSTIEHVLRQVMSGE